MSSHPVIILGNGPSRGRFDLPRLGAPTIGMDGAVAEWKAKDFRPTFYVCLDAEEGIAHAEAIDLMVQENRVRRFLLRDEVCRLIGKSPRILNYDHLRRANAFFAVEPVSSGSHALLLAIALGYRLVGFAGVDVHRPTASPASAVTPAEEPASQEPPPISAEPAHDGSSSDASERGGLDDAEVERQLQAWTAVGKLAAPAGVRVFNIADESLFDQFPYLSLEDFRCLALRTPR